MRHALTKEHLDFYYRYHSLTCEDLLSPKQVGALQEATAKVLSKRLKKNDDAKQKYRAGYDTWRDHPTIKKIVLSSRLAEVASTLSKVEPLRLAFDQVFSENIFDTSITLKELCSIQPPACALLLPLTSGAGTFYSPRCLLPFEEIDSPHLLIAYAAEKALYKRTPTDPNTHACKQLGYVFGDRLTSKTHPVVYSLRFG